MPTPLEYSAERPARRWPFRLFVIIVLLLLFVGYWILRGDMRTSAEVRLDTGDLRYCYFGIPMVYQRMPEPKRSRLLALAAKSKILTSEWRTCAIFPLQSSNNEDSMCREWYFNADLWIAEDPELARLMLEDVATYLRATNARSGLPDSASLLFGGAFIEMNSKGVWAVKDNWRQDETAQIYMAYKHYTPPTTQSSPSTQP